MDQIGLSDITAALLPRMDDPIILVLDLLLYIMFFMNLVAFFMQDDRQLIATLLMGLAILAVLVGKLSTFYAGGRSPIEFIEADELPMLIVNCVIFVTPIIVTGMSKAKKSKPITIISGLLGGAYFFMFWFFLQLNP